MAAKAILARGWTFKIGAQAIGGILQFTPAAQGKKTITTIFANQGQESHVVASRTKSIKLSGLYFEDPSTGVRDAGQAAVEALAEQMGDASVGSFTITSPGGHIGTFTATAIMDAPGGGGNDDETKWECTLDITPATISWT